MNRKKVLLADDVELFLELEKTFFRREDVDLLVARTGQQALDLIVAQRPDLVFMDLYMPEMNGDDACRQIKNRSDLSTTPVVMVTHAGRQADVDRCRAAGCDDILFKPINRHLFLDTARRFLDLVERKAPRIPSRLRVRYGESKNQELHEFSINLSTGGLFLETDQPLPVDTPISVEVPLPGNDRPIHCRARVAWNNDPQRKSKPQLPPGMGVQFIGLGLEDLQAIREYVKQQCLSPSQTM